MTCDTLRADIEGARTFARLDELAPRIWEGLNIDDAEACDRASRLAEAAHARRRSIEAEGAGPFKPLAAAFQGRRSIFALRPYVPCPDRAKSRERRRTIAASGPLPPSLAARFTTGQQAVLGIVADEVAANKGACTLCVEAIAARAGVTRRLAQTALRLAEGDGLLTIEERPRKGQPHDTNRIRILDKGWRAWIERRHRGAAKRRQAETAPNVDMGGGCKSVRPSDSGYTFGRTKRPDETRTRATEGEQAGPPARSPLPSRFADKPARKGRQHAPGAWGRSA